MTENADRELTPEEALERHEMLWDLHHALLRRWSELMLKELLEAKTAYRSLDPFMQAYSLSAWDKKISLIFQAMDVFERRYTGQRGELRLVEEKYGDQLKRPASVLPSDISERLAWYKNKISNDFEREVREDINFYGITSAIEQIFLMEWKFKAMAEKHGLKLTPQKKIKSGDVEYVVDFHVTKPGSGFSLCIEIDGHEFHEKTMQQVARDKRRERDLIAEGHTLLRFTGSEVFRNAQERVTEVLTIIERRLATSIAEAKT